MINFRDGTTESSLRNNTVIFEFEFDPITRVNTSLGIDLRLTWRRVNGTSSGIIVVANCKYFNQSDAQLKRIGQTGTYQLSVPLHLLGEGSLLVQLATNISCIRYQYIFGSWHRNTYPKDWCGCIDWQIRGSSHPLEISAKRG